MKFFPLPLSVLGFFVLLTGCLDPEPIVPEVVLNPVSVDSARLVREDSTLRYSVNVLYPQLSGGDSAAIARINAAILVPLTAQADEVRPDLAGFSDDQRNPDGSLPFWVVGTFEGGYQTPFVNDTLFSTLFTGSIYTGGAHPNGVSIPLTFDLRTGQALRLDDFFRPDFAWRDSLATLATQRLMEDPEIFQGLFSGEVLPEEDVISHFYLTADTLTLYFPHYSIGPYAMGAHAVPIPLSRISSLLRR